MKHLRDHWLIYFVLGCNFFLNGIQVQKGAEQIKLNQQFIDRGKAQLQINANFQRRLNMIEVAKDGE